MRSPRNAPARRARESGSIIILLLVVLAALGGGYYFLKQNRDMREKEAWAFANDAANRIVLQRDQRFIDFNLTQKAQMQYPPSWRIRMLEYIREAGTPNPQFHVKGDVAFTNQFFDPHANFTVQFDYPTGPGYLELHVSHPGALWVIDDLNWTWPPPATPTPAPIAPVPGAQPSPGPQVPPAATPHR
jgi:hypothetical protein